MSRNNWESNYVLLPNHAYPKLWNAINTRLPDQLPAVIALQPFVTRPQQPKRKNTMFEAYHDVTGAQHQANFNNLSAQGYRMISLSVYGDPGNPLYAAVWVQRSGPAWEAVHGVDAAGYQAFFDTWTAKGYVPVGYQPLQ